MTWRRFGSSAFWKLPGCSGRDQGAEGSSSHGGLWGAGAPVSRWPWSRRSWQGRRYCRLDLDHCVRPRSPRVSEMKFGLFLFVPPSGFVGRGGWWRGRRGQSVFKVLGTSYKNIRKLFLCNYRTERFGSNPQPGVKTPKTKSGLLAPLRLPPRPRPVTPGSFGTPWPLAVGTPEPLGSSSFRGVGF